MTGCLSGQVFRGRHSRTKHQRRIDLGLTEAAQATALHCGCSHRPDRRATVGGQVGDDPGAHHCHQGDGTGGEQGGEAGHCASQQ